MKTFFEMFIEIFPHKKCVCLLVIYTLCDLNDSLI